MEKLCSYTFLTVLAVALLASSSDLTLTWTSPILPKLYSTDLTVNPLSRPITPDEDSWIGSLLNIGAFIGPLPFGFLCDKFGRKFCLLSIAIPYIVSFLLLAFVPNLYCYYFSRFFTGISLGASSSLLSIYISEIAEDSNRGRLSGTLNIFWTFGNLVPYVLGPYLSIAWFNVTLACFPAFFFVVFLVVGPESPYFLIARGKTGEAEESLMKLRSKSRSAVGQEIIKIQTALQQSKSAKSDRFLDLFKSRANSKAIRISLILIILQQLSGVNAVLFYTQMIFEVSGSNIPAEISAIIIGLVLFVSSWITPFCADRFGRRFFMIISTLGMAAALATLATYLYLKETTTIDVTSISFLPIVSLMVFITAWNIGFSVMPWTISSELFPPNVKHIGSSLVSLGCWLGSFIVTKFFNDLNDFLGIAGSFWLFSGFCFVAFLFTYFCVPETKGKSFKEIQEFLEN